MEPMSINSETASEASIIDVEDLSTRFFTGAGQVNAVESVSFSVDRGEVFGIVGESGSGKSVTAKSLMGLLSPAGEITNGTIWYRDPELAEQVSSSARREGGSEFVDLTRLPERARESLLGSSMSMIFQDPGESFNPTQTIGNQIAEAVEVERRMSANEPGNFSIDYNLLDLVLGQFRSSKRFVSRESKQRAIELIDAVDIPDPDKAYEQYPHEFSGGMLQRAMIAQALAGDPDVLVADEPTTGLDVTIEAQILALLDDIQERTEMSIVLITHNLGVISRMCDRVGVMYAGEMVERGTLSDVFVEPVHPYTKGLIDSVPDLDSPSSRLEAIDGNVPDLMASTMGDGCYFADRCPKAMEKCNRKPPEFTVSQSHRTMCYLAEDDEETELAEAGTDE
jgi:peptide/nickel transport system ATP-binding protein